MPAEPVMTDAALQRALQDAVSLVNLHAGNTCVRLRFNEDPDALYEFMASSASFQNGAFEFRAGIESYVGSVEELAEIRSEVVS